MIWYLILRRDVKPHGECPVSLDEHLAWMRQEQQTGKILFSGPSSDRTLGIYVVRADSRDEAELVAHADPFTKAGCCTFELIEWHVDQALGVGPFTESAIAAISQTTGGRK